MVYILCIFKIEGDIKHLNSFVDIDNISINFEVKKMVDKIWKSRYQKFSVFCDTTKLCLRNNLTWNKDDIDLIPCF